MIPLKVWVVVGKIFMYLFEKILFFRMNDEKEELERKG